MEVLWLSHVDAGILATLDNKEASTWPPTITPDAGTRFKPPAPRGQYKDIGPVRRPPLPPSNQPMQISEGSSRKPQKQRKPPKPHGERAKRTLSTKEATGLPQNQRLKKRKRPDNSSTTYFSKLKKNRESLALC